MKRGRGQSGSFRRRILVIAAEVLFGIGIVILALLYSVHERDPWMPRPGVVTASFWIILGLVEVGLSIQSKLLQRVLLQRYGAEFPVLESWFVLLASGIAALILGVSRLSDILGHWTLPKGTGRLALIAYYALSGAMSLFLGTKLFRWSFDREEQSPEANMASSEVISFKERMSMVLPGVFIAYQGVRLLIAAWVIMRDYD